MDELKETYKYYRNAYRLLNELERRINDLLIYLLEQTKYYYKEGNQGPHFYEYFCKLKKYTEIPIWRGQWGWDFLSANMGQYYVKEDDIPEFSILKISDTGIISCSDKKNALDFEDSDKCESLLVFLYNNGISDPNYWEMKNNHFFKDFLNSADVDYKDSKGKKCYARKYLLDDFTSREVVIDKLKDFDAYLKSLGCDSILKQ